jgi:CheY-like chemotaxis protein
MNGKNGVKESNGKSTKDTKKQEVVLLLAEDDDGHAELITGTLHDAGILNEVIRFRDGEETLEFFYGNGKKPAVREGVSYLLLLDIRMPKVDGVAVLERLKKDPRFQRMPIIMLTTTDEPREIKHCHALGCNSYVTKPIVFADFVNKLRSLGLFIMVIEVPKL